MKGRSSSPEDSGTTKEENWNPELSESLHIEEWASPLYLLYSENANSQANATKQETKDLVSEQAKEFQRKEL